MMGDCERCGWADIWDDDDGPMDSSGYMPVAATCRCDHCGARYTIEGDPDGSVVGERLWDEDRGRRDRWRLLAAWYFSESELTRIPDRYGFNLKRI